MTKYLLSVCLLAAMHSAVAGVIPVGAKNDVSINTVTNDWGWEFIYRNAYNVNHDSGDKYNYYFGNAKSGDWIMLGSINNSNNTFDVLAAVSFDDLLGSFTFGDNTKNFNGSSWYNVEDYSIGFAGLGKSVSLTSADTAGGDERDRLSWHMHEHYDAGYRSGDNVGLNESTDFDKAVLVYRSSNSVPEPTSIAILGLGLVGLAFARKKKSV